MFSARMCVGILEKLSAKLVGPNQLALENGKYKIKFRRDHVEFSIFVFRRDHVATKWDEGWVVNVHIGWNHNEGLWTLVAKLNIYYINTPIALDY